jgi:hypothetical protein
LGHVILSLSDVILSPSSHVILSLSNVILSLSNVILSLSKDDKRQQVQRAPASKAPLRGLGRSL